MINIPVFDQDGNIKRKGTTTMEKCEVMTFEELQQKVKTYTPRQLLTLYNWWDKKDKYSYRYYDIRKEIEGEILRRMEGNKEAVLIPNADCGECEVELHTTRLDYE